MVLIQLSNLRKSKKWSMQETADRLGIAKSTYAGYESGYREPSLKAVSQIADLFDITVDDILGRDKRNSPSLELTDLLRSEIIPLTLDGSLLSAEEVVDFIAFTRMKRELKS